MLFDRVQLQQRLCLDLLVMHAASRRAARATHAAAAALTAAALAAAAAARGAAPPRRDWLRAGRRCNLALRTD